MGKIYITHTGGNDADGKGGILQKGLGQPHALLDQVLRQADPHFPLKEPGKVFWVEVQRLGNFRTANIPGQVFLYIGEYPFNLRSPLALPLAGAIFHIFRNEVHKLQHLGKGGVGLHYGVVVHFAENVLSPFPVLHCAQEQRKKMFVKLEKSLRSEAPLLV